MNKTYVIIHGNDSKGNLRYRIYTLNKTYEKGANYNLPDDVNVMVTDKVGKDFFFEIVHDKPIQERFFYGGKIEVESESTSRWIIDNLEKLLAERGQEIADSLKHIILTYDADQKKMVPPPDPLLSWAII